MRVARNAEFNTQPLVSRNPYQSPALDPDPPEPSQPPKLSFWKLAINGLFAGVLYGAFTGTLVSFVGGVFGLAWDWSASLGEQAETHDAIAMVFAMASFGAMWGTGLGGACGCFISCVVRLGGPKTGFWAHYLCQVVPAIATLSSLMIAMIHNDPDTPHRNFGMFVVLFFLVTAGAVFFAESMTTLCQRKIWGE